MAFTRATILFCLFSIHSLSAGERIINGSLLSSTLERAREERVAVIAVGDSNMERNGRGWSWYFTKHLLEEYGCYGTGLQYLGKEPLNGYKVSSRRGPTASSSGAPEPLNVYAPGGTGFPRYLFVPIGGNATAGTGSNGIAAHIHSNHPIGLSDEVSFRFTFGQFSDGENYSYIPQLRLAQAPWITLLKGEQRNTVTDLDGIEDYTMTLPPSVVEDSDPLNVFVNPRNSIVNGPFYWLYWSAENNEKSSGLSCQTLVSAPGKSLRDMLEGLDDFGGIALNEYFRQVRLGLTSSEKTCIVYINSGLNDRNEASPSLGPNPVMDGDSGEAYEDNLRGVVARLLQAWIAQGGTANTIHFCFIPSHPQPGSGDTKLELYREAAIGLAMELENASCIVLSDFLNSDDFEAGGWYESNPAHLTNEGYDQVGKIIVDTIQSFVPWYEPLKSIDGDWVQSDWFGWLNATNNPWIYHAQHGWLYTTPESTESVWMWSKEFGWCWCSSSSYPWLWAQDRQGWVNYSVGSTGPRWFYDALTKKWEPH